MKNYIIQYKILSKKEIIKAIKSGQIGDYQKDLFNETKSSITKIEKITKKEIKYKCLYHEEDNVLEIISYIVCMPKAIKDKLELMKIMLNMWLYGHHCSELYALEVDENGRLRKFDWEKDKEFDIRFEP